MDDVKRLMTAAAEAVLRGDPDAVAKTENAIDQFDYHVFLTELGWTDENIRPISENPLDQIPMPKEARPTFVGPSRIDRLGLFAGEHLNTGTVIAPARISGLRTPAGRYPNHSRTPNARMIVNGVWDIDLVALRDIPAETEITVSYRESRDALQSIDAMLNNDKRRPAEGAKQTEAVRHE